MLPPINFQKWINDNRHLLKPPVLNQAILAEDDFIVQIVGGPNIRTDYHDDPYEEFFFQLKGDMTLKVFEDGKLRDKPINEGNILLIPPHMPHSPQRPDPESIGMGVERVRPSGVMDAFEWYCEKCFFRVWRKEVRVDNIVKDLPPVFEEYYETVAPKNCKECGHPHPQKLKTKMVT